MRLGNIATLIRSKNAGPFLLSIDIIFNSDYYYNHVKNSNILNFEKISDIYHVDTEDVEIYYNDSAKMIKISFPRNINSGNRNDIDVFGGQQHGPLVELIVPGGKK